MRSVDAFVEIRSGGEAWERAQGVDSSPGPWSVPEAVEVGRTWWAMFVRLRLDAHGFAARVVDGDGGVVEAWPKR